jgi:polysaccharide pyruvyl transferase CsaB
MRKAKCIVIGGYYGFGNAGDELILRSIVEQLRAQDPERQITVLSNRPEATRRDFGVQAVDRWRPWQWIKPLWQADLFLLGGGGLLQESTGPWNYFYYLFQVVLAKCLGCRTEIHAIGVDPMGNALHRSLTRWVCNFFVNRISVRDHESQRVLEVSGVWLPVLRMADPVFRLRLPPPTNAEPGGIAFVLAPWPQRLGWDHDLALLMDRVIEQLGTPIEMPIFFPEKDERFCRRVASLTNDRISLRTWQRPEDLLALMPRYELIIGMRYHALVLAALAGKPFIGWGFQHKVRSLCSELGQPIWSFERGWDAEAVFRQITEAWRQRAALPDRYKLQVAPMKVLAAEPSHNLFYSKTAI